MDAPPGVACLDTRHPRRLLVSGQAQIPHPLFMTKPRLAEWNLLFEVRGRASRIVHIYSFELQARPGRGYAASLRGVILGVVGRGYARSCIRTSENTYSRQLGE